ncbi:MAG: DUF1080 domain-containing protein [Candidatus Eisenbacteria bacterium]|nr:DUF1080 domain-containing protein [Candidatus Eisenbacteria bacterium]
MRATVRTWAWCGLALAAIATAAAAGVADPERFATPPPPPRVSAPAGRVLFSDHFASPALAGWSADRDSVWSVWRGMLRADLPDEKQERSLIHAGDDAWTDYALDFDVCMMRGVDKGAVLRIEGQTGLGVDLRGGSYQDVVMNVREWRIGHANVTNPNGTWQHVRVEAHGRRWRVFVNGELKLDRRDARRPRGHFALAAYTGGVGQCTVYYDNVVVTALE